MNTVSILQCFTSNEIFLINKGTFDLKIPCTSAKYTRLGQLDGTFGVSARLFLAQAAKLKKTYI